MNQTIDQSVSQPIDRSIAIVPTAYDAPSSSVCVTPETSCTQVELTRRRRSCAGKLGCSGRSVALRRPRSSRTWRDRWEAGRTRSSPVGQVETGCSRRFEYGWRRLQIQKVRHNKWFLFDVFRLVSYEQTILKCVPFTNEWMNEWIL